MTLASLLHDDADSSALPIITRHSKTLSTGDFSWADMPLVGDIDSLIAAEPLEKNLNKNIGKEDDTTTPNLNDVEMMTSFSTCSSFSSMSDNHDNESAPSRKRRGGHKTGAASFDSEETQHVVAIGSHRLSGDAVPRSVTTWADSEAEQDLDNLQYDLQPMSGGNPKKKHQKIHQPDALK